MQRVARASVSVEGEKVGAVDGGLLVLLGAGPDDTEAQALRLADRIATLRIFPDAAGRMNLDVTQTDPAGAILVVSQFTLFADTSRGHRPSLIGAATPHQAAGLCDVFVAALRERGIRTETGRFGAHMDVDLRNEGPVTLVLSSGEPPWPADAG